MRIWPPNGARSEEQVPTRARPCIRRMGPIRYIMSSLVAVRRRASDRLPLDPARSPSPPSAAESFPTTDQALEAHATAFSRSRPASPEVPPGARRRFWRRRYPRGRPGLRPFGPCAAPRSRSSSSDGTGSGNAPPGRAFGLRSPVEDLWKCHRPLLRSSMASERMVLEHDLRPGRVVSPVDETGSLGSFRTKFLVSALQETPRPGSPPALPAAVPEGAELEVCAAGPLDRVARADAPPVGAPRDARRSRRRRCQRIVEA